MKPTKSMAMAYLSGSQATATRAITRRTSAMAMES